MICHINMNEFSGGIRYSISAKVVGKFRYIKLVVSNIKVVSGRPSHLLH